MMKNGTLNYSNVKFDKKNKDIMEVLSGLEYRCSDFLIV